MGQRTLCAFGRPGDTNLPTEKYDPVAEVAAFLRRQNGTELLFHLFRLLAFGKSQTAANTDAVGVADYTDGLTVKVTQ